MTVSSFFGIKNKKSEGAILIDIGSSSVGAAVVIFDSEEKPNIVFEIREHFSIQARLNNRRLLPLTIDATNKIMEIVFKKGLSTLVNKEGHKVPLKRIICSFSSPWHVSTTKTLHFKFEKPFNISSSFIEDIISYEGKNFVSKLAKEDASGSFIQEQKSAVSKQEVLRTFINGYPILYPIGMRANELEMIIFICAFPRQLVKSFEKIFGKHFPDIIPDFNSGTEVYFHVLRELFPDEGSFIITHIGGETTDVSVVKKNIITETISFPLGRNFIVRRLMDEVPGVTSEVALSMIKVNSEGVSAPKFSERLTKILAQAEEDWVELFADSMRDFSKDFFLPTRIFVLAGDDSAKTFSDLITKKKLPVRGPKTPLLTAEEVNVSLFDDFINNEPQIIRDSFLSAGAFFSDRKYFKKRGV